ncbi:MULTISPECIES: hypothetical protein [Gammaproteobacteria]|uniref:hypothetical protein n=1 Tax=Gammaproteobacteria TaxID=1236 RepID=UPI0018684FBD|nr:MULTISPECIES: hypothetical protein [Gammaproteobacteria]
MISPKWITSLFGQANQTGEKSTIIHPLLWVIGILISALIAEVYFKADNLLKVGTFILLLAILVFLMVVYWHCLTNNPDYLRSEKWSIQKMAIEKQVVGDSYTGEHIENQHINLTNSEKDYGNPKVLNITSSNDGNKDAAEDKK